MTKVSNLPKWCSGCMKFNNMIGNIVAPNFLRPTKDDFKDNKARFFVKSVASACWGMAVCGTAFVVAPIPTITVAAASVVARKAVQTHVTYTSAKASGLTKVEALAETHKTHLNPDIEKMLRGLSTPHDKVPVRKTTLLGQSQGHDYSK